MDWDPAPYKTCNLVQVIIQTLTFQFMPLQFYKKIM